VRHEWADITRFMHQHAKAMGLMMTVLVCLVIGSIAHWGLRPQVITAPTPQHLALRELAKNDCAQNRSKA
jgi:hypothetical protein